MSAAGPSREHPRARRKASAGSERPRACAAVDAPLAVRFNAASLDWIVPAWPAPRSVHAFFTTRNGGASTGMHASLDLGSSSLPEDRAGRDAVAENRSRVEAFLPAPPCWLDQVHGPDVVMLNDPRQAATRAWPRADAAVTRLPDVVLAVRVADCLPVLLAHRRGSVVGIAHAGWRSLAAGVLENTVAAMACAAEDLVAWFGPAIGSTAFEVGDDVRDAFMASDADAHPAFVRGRPGKWHADLGALARRRLANAGVHDVSSADACTVSNPGRFFSYRRDRATGRMAAFIWRTSTA